MMHRVGAALRLRARVAGPKRARASYSSSAGPLQWYAAKLNTHPLATKCITSGLIAGSGDALCQYLSSRQEGGEEGGAVAEKNPTYEPVRTARFFVLGSVFTAPIIHVWYGFLMTSIPGSGIRAIGKRLLCDQGLFAPIFLPTFISSLTVLEHLTPGSDRRDDNTQHAARSESDLYSRVMERLRNDVPDALVANWITWIPAMAFMFAYVPSKFQVLYSNCVGFFWNAYLSWRTHEGERDHENDKTN